MKKQRLYWPREKGGLLPGVWRTDQGKTETGDCSIETITGYKVIQEMKQEEVMVLSKQLIYDIIIDWVYENKLPISLKQMEELGTKIWEKMKPPKGK